MYVKRDNGKIVGAYSAPQDFTDPTPLDANDPDLLAYLNPVSVPEVHAPTIYASAGIIISAGIVTALELAPQIASAYYEDGWMQIFFAELPGYPYLVFVQTDIPVKVEQFKDLGSFELIFSDPLTGDPSEPGRIDLQILKVR